jgi:hypothetical protein
MRKYLLAATALCCLAGSASADVILSTNGSAGTGDNVIFDSEALDGRSALGHLNDPNSHNDVVRFTDFAGAAFTSVGATSGNDIKITGVTDLGVQVFDSTNSILQGTSKQVFSLSGSGNVTLIVDAVNAFGVAEQFTFPNMGQPGPFTLGNNQSFFILTVANGETMTSLEIRDTSGTITDFEHYRIDPVSLAVPGPAVGAGIPGIVAGCFALIGLAKRRRQRQLAN